MKTSEWVSLGHPDKTADYISEYILDRLYELDKSTLYALEVQIKGNHVSLGGEITTDAEYDLDDLKEWMKAAVRQIGYTREYAEKWGYENALNADEIELTARITRQSYDIARGVYLRGWGDQGIFWGMAVRDSSTSFMPKDIYYARKIGMALFNTGKYGLDIKTQVTLNDDNHAEQVIIAVPVFEKDKEFLNRYAEIACENIIGSKPDELIVNGTGTFTCHSSMADCGTTGRKLAVDFYGGNCEIGGGSPWTKDYTKADLTLNAYARRLAFDYLLSTRNVDVVKCKISCCIGKKNIFVTFLDDKNTELDHYSQEISPMEVAHKINLLSFGYAALCADGLPYAMI